MRATLILAPRYKWGDLCAKWLRANESWARRARIVVATPAVLHKLRGLQNPNLIIYEVRDIWVMGADFEGLKLLNDAWLCRPASIRYLTGRELV